MSQWNNSYQYQDPNVWNGDANGQYANQNPNHYQERQYQNQYVSFDQFLTQIQNNQPRNSNYSDAQYQNYAMNQYNNYTAMPSSSQISHNYNAGSSTSVPNGEEYQATAKSNGAVSKNASSYQNDVPFHSNLTATATEFVPKNYTMTASTSSNQTEPSTSYDPEQCHNENTSKQQEYNTYNKPFLNRNNQRSNSNSNWRERGSTSQPNQELQNNKIKNKKENRVQDTENKNREGSPRTQQFEASKQDARNGAGKSNKNSKGKNKDTDSARTFYNSKTTNQDVSLENDSRSKKNQDAKPERDQDRPGRDENQRPFRDNESRNGRNQNSARNEYYRSERDQEPKSERGQSSRSSRNNDSRTRDNDSRYPRDNESRLRDFEPRSRGEGSNRRTWAGSQRVRPEQNNVDDEQFANSYVPYKEESYGDRDRNYGDRDKYYDRERDRGDRERDRDRTRAVGAYNSPLRQQKPQRAKNKQVYDAEMGKELTQRERLSEQLDKGTLECLVCCDRVRQTDSVWSCQNCYHVLHLNCIRKWATSSAHEGKWRCPACQNESLTIPREYRCMCGAASNPEYSRGAGAHTCGGPCRRPRACVHPCALACHPGPCPPCQATVNKQCGCGAETRSVLCSSKLAQECGRTCHRPLNCKVHTCEKPCHEGPCDDCAQTITQVCYCPSAQSRGVACTEASSKQSQWACGAACGRVLACGAHVCRARCHAPPCPPCALLPELVGTCPCGSLKLSKEQRKSCTDAIPLCGNICARPRPCGPAGDKHFCKLECHQGECPACPDTTLVACRCEHSARELPCAQLPQAVTCQKKCNKKLSCGRHRCRSLCCVDDSHRCGAVCGRSLSCQLHRCQNLCHTGHCAPCPILSFEELSCECGRETLLPPVRCGVKPPACLAPCARGRACGHEPHHACHAGPCPPCVVLTTKKCHGGHEERKTIPCSQEEFSCGMACGRPLPCGKHSCAKVCHNGPCDAGKCTQPCAEKRPSCGHPCGAACHSDAGGPCPSPAPCRRPVRATCQCGRRAAERPCAESARDRAKMMSALAATKMADGGSVDLSDVTRPGNQLKTLECDDECRLEQRTRQMALALQIRNPDVSAKLAPRYSEHARQWAARDPAFADLVHLQLTTLVQKAKKSKQKTRAHSFPSMNRQKRQFVHEMCEHFGCESVAYDAEPNRNVVATADREKSWLPAMSVLEVLQREAGRRRVPGPVLRPAPPAASAANNTTTTSGWATLTSTKTNAWAARSQPAPTSEPAPTPAPAPKIDYFDNPPE